MTNIRKSTAKLLQEKFNIDPDKTELLFKEGILQEHHCRDLLIKAEFDKRAKPKEKQILRHELATEYFVSVSLVEKLTL